MQPTMDVMQPCMDRTSVFAAQCVLVSGVCKWMQRGAESRVVGNGIASDPILNQRVVQAKNI